MFQRKMIACISAFVFAFSIVTIGNVYAQIRVDLLGPDLPPVIDGNKQRSIEIQGRVIGVGETRYIRIQSLWANLRKFDPSPALERDQYGYFKHTFSIGGAEKCGWVCFRGEVGVSNVSVASEEHCTYVDCNPPRILIGKPEDGQIIKPGTPIQVEVRVEDDMLLANVARKPYKLADTKYTLKVDVDGSTSLSPEFLAWQLKEQTPVRKFSIPGLSPGRHAIRFTLTDPSGKSDEKTIFVKADGTPPSVRIISPVYDERITIQGGSMATITVTVEATDAGEIASGVEKVEFYMNGQGVGVVHAPSNGNRYTKTFGVPDEGQKTIMVKAFDKVGNHSQKSIQVFVAFEGKPKPTGQVPAPPKTLPTKPKTR